MLSTPLQVLDKLEGGQDIHGADIALKRHEAIRTDVEARVSDWELGKGGGGGGFWEGVAIGEVGVFGRLWQLGRTGSKRYDQVAKIDEILWKTSLEQVEND